MCGERDVGRIGDCRWQMADRRWGGVNEQKVSPTEAHVPVVLVNRRVQVLALERERTVYPMTTRFGTKGSNCAHLRGFPRLGLLFFFLGRLLLTLRASGLEQTAQHKGTILFSYLEKPRLLQAAFRHTLKKIPILRRICISGRVPRLASAT